VSVATLVVLSPGRSTDSGAIAVESSSTSTPGTAGLRAYLDPETGELAVGVAPAGVVELDAEMQNALRRDDEGLQVIRHANGAGSLDLQGRSPSVCVVRIDVNGNQIICTDNAVGLEHSLDESTSHPATLEVK
jgi:hypothetical protein